MVSSADSLKNRRAEPQELGPVKILPSAPSAHERAKRVCTFAGLLSFSALEVEYFGSGMPKVGRYVG